MGGKSWREGDLLGDTSSLVWGKTVVIWLDSGIRHGGPRKPFLGRRFIEGIVWVKHIRYKRKRWFERDEMSAKVWLVSRKEGCLRIKNAGGVWWHGVLLDHSLWFLTNGAPRAFQLLAVHLDLGQHCLKGFRTFCCRLESWWLVPQGLFGFPLSSWLLMASARWIYMMSLLLLIALLLPWVLSCCSTFLG